MIIRFPFINIILSLYNVIYTDTCTYSLAVPTRPHHKLFSVFEKKTLNVLKGLLKNLLLSRRDNSIIDVNIP